MENTPNTTAANPLSKYFRQPAIYMKLPSRGQYWPENSLDLPVTGEIPVFPMTAKDEVTLRTPDALMNGSGVIEVVHSCCPNIRDAWGMPSIDVDAVLIGIRIASYGHEMAVDTECPYCQAENNNAVDLRVILGGIAAPSYSDAFEVEGLKVRLKPQAYFGVNRQNAINFEEQRMLNAVQTTSELTEEEKIKQINESMERLIKLSIDTVVASTESIELPDGTIVKDSAFIGEFYNNANGQVVRSIQKRLAEINVEGAIKPQATACTSCTKEYTVPLEFDYASFFATGS
jgi:hypothetical protein